MDEQDTQGLADSVINTTLNTLADQQDDSQEQILSGVIKTSPQAFYFGAPSSPRHLEVSSDTNTRQHVVVGPIKFTTRFRVPPAITFGEAANSLTELVQQPIQVGTNYVPFIVHSYVYNFDYVNGEVDGFYIGMYALTAPPAGLAIHTVSWIASGLGSRYNQQDSVDSWSMAYDQNEAGFLTDDVAYWDTNET